MKLNEDIDQAKQRWKEWFEGRLTGGPLVCVTAPLDRPRQEPFELTCPQDPRQMRSDVEYRVRAARNEFMATWFGGDAIPSWHVNLGPGSLAGYLGGKLRFDDRTVWFGGYEDNSLANILKTARYDADQWYWRLTLELTRRSLEMSGGDYWISYVDMGGELDVLASLRGSQNLLADLVESPDLVHRCEDRICELWLKYFRELTEVFDASSQQGYTCWMPCYSDRPWFTLQCDISAMFSPDMFGEFVVPRLKRKAAALGHTIYHWDGPGELAHLDHILSVPGIDALEYVSVPRDPPNCSLHWLPYYRRIAEAGKGVFLRSSRPDLAYELSRNMPADKLAFTVSFPSVSQAKEYLARFGR